MVYRMAAMTLSDLEGHFSFLKPFQLPYLGKYTTLNYDMCTEQEGQHPPTGQRATNFRLLANH